MNPDTPHATITAGDAPAARRGSRLAVVTAVVGTVLIALGAFWLSFTALADLARRSGSRRGRRGRGR